MNGWMDGWMTGLMNGWMDGWMDVAEAAKHVGCFLLYIYIYVAIDGTIIYILYPRIKPHFISDTLILHFNQSPRNFIGISPGKHVKISNKSKHKCKKLIKSSFKKFLRLIRERKLIKLFTGRSRFRCI